MVWPELTKCVEDVKKDILPLHTLTTRLVWNAQTTGTTAWLKNIAIAFLPLVTFKISVSSETMNAYVQ